MVTTIAWYEFLFTIKRKGYLFATFGMPLILAIYAAVVSLFSTLSHSTVKSELNRAVGIVDNSGILSRVGGALEGVPYGQPHAYISPRYEGELLKRKLEQDQREVELESYTRIVIPYESFTQALESITSGVVGAVVVIDRNYLSNSQAKLYQSRNVLQGFSGIFPVENLLHESLLKQNQFPAETAKAMLRGSVVREYEVDKLGSISDRDSLSKTLAFGVPLGLSFMLIMALMMNCGLLISSVTQERENKVIEILLSSVEAEDLLFGKVIGLVGSGLLQMVVWMIMVLSLPSIWLIAFAEQISLQLSATQIILALVFGVLGLIFYGVLFAGFGSLGNTERDTRYLSSFALVISGLPLMVALPISIAPNGTVARIASLIPFFSPSALILRITHAEVATWEIALSLAILLASIWLAVRWMARLFRFGVSMQGQKLSLATVWKALRQ